MLTDALAIAYIENGRRIVRAGHKKRSHKLRYPILDDLDAIVVASGAHDLDAPHDVDQFVIDDLDGEVGSLLEIVTGVPAIALIEPQCAEHQAESLIISAGGSGVMLHGRVFLAPCLQQQSILPA
ncbi:carbamoyltransferase N-terminal domain-containing protein [Methylobacterium nodulans]|uniref:carbamoyltransferase N-terminal domain-containing protein n=1 Tax=Methylobacterium nodulans TaxID=114616 RepID=UPI0012EDD274